jgi:predicted nucleotidyltransferase
VEAAILYGSRAKGNYKEWSDIDLALTGEIGLPTLFNITHLLDELSLPYFFDVTLLKEFGFARTYQSKRSSILQPAERSY